MMLRRILLPGRILPDRILLPGSSLNPGQRGLAARIARGSVAGLRRPPPLWA
jgi:hypothetical protein